jgi:ribonucleoside-diphosphate reductase alpha chain
VQAVAQEYIDSSISKTVNAPNKHTVEDVEELYMAAYDMGLKGITYMRDGSRQGVLQREEKKEEKKAEVLPPSVSTPLYPDVRRPMLVEGVTYKTESPLGKTYVTVNHDEQGNPFEVFITIGKSGSDVAAIAEGLSRMISFVLRLHSNVPPKERMTKVISELAGIGGSRTVGFGENRVRSLPDAVAKVLARYLNRYEVVASETAVTNGNGHATNGNGLSNGNGHTPVMVEQLSMEHAAVAFGTAFFMGKCGTTT